MDNFIQLLKESTIVQGLLTLMIWGAVIYQIISGQPPSEILLATGGSIIGFYFGQKVLKPPEPVDKQR